MAVTLFSSAWGNPTSRIIGVGADPLQFIWFFTWPAYALTHGQNPFITRAIDYPSGVNLMWNSSALLIGLVSWPVRALFGPILNFNLVETLAPALSAWTAFLWIRRKVSHPVAAALGAALFGFSPGMLGQLLGHPHVAAAFLPPLMLIVLEDILIYERRSPVVAGGVLGMMGAAQLLIGEEVLVTTALIAFLGIGVLAGMYPSRLRERLPRAAAGLAAAGGVFMVLSAVPLAIQFFGPQRLHSLVHAKDTYVADLLSFVTPDQQQWLAPARFLRLFSRFAGSSLAESDAYLGVPLILLLLFIAIRHWERPAVRVATTLAALLGALSLGGTIHVAGHATAVPGLALVVLIPWFWRAVPVPAVVLTFTIAWLALNRVPFLANVLAVRLTIFIYLFAGLLLAVFVDAMLNRARRQRAVGVVALLAALVPLTPALPYSAFSAEVPAYFSGAGVGHVPGGSVAMVFPYADASHANAMLWQAVADMRFAMPSGYAFVPDSAPAFLDPPPSASYALNLAILGGADPMTLDTAGVLADIRRWNVQEVLVGPMPNEAAMVAVLTRAIGSPPTRSGDVFVWDGLGTAAFRHADATASLHPLLDTVLRAPKGALLEAR
ncbi:MAG: hypothetical protein QOH92_1621 [Chloroflexota bacterium]|jgi:hypothetical protein|nr:hypothetical protein [Chloroflexota bacterium]